MYKRDENLNDLLRGKTVAYVCPSAHLVGTNSGKKIDSYDLVCRVSQEFPLPENRYVDYGSRTDILMSACNPDCMIIMNAEFKGTDYFKNLKYVVCPQGEHNEHKEESFQKLNEYNIPFHIIGDEYMDVINRTAGTVTNSGLSGVITLLNYDLKELYITGMSFYGIERYVHGYLIEKGGRLYDVYYKEYADMLKKHLSFTDEHIAGLTFGHNQIPQIQYFVRILQRNRVITLDDYLTRAFTLKE